VPIPTQPPNLVTKDVIDLEVAVEVEAVDPSCREHLTNLHDHPYILQTILDPTNPAKAPSSLDILWPSPYPHEVLLEVDQAPVNLPSSILTSTTSAILIPCTDQNHHQLAQFPALAPGELLPRVTI